MTDQQPLRSTSDPASPQSSDNRWRTEITDRVAGYRHRRGRRIEGAFSMRFPFPPVASADATAESPSLRQSVESPEPSAVSPVAALVVEATPETKPDSSSALTLDREPSSTTIAAESTPPAEVPAFSDDPDAEPLPEPSSPPPHAPRPPSRRKVIAFPRQASLAPETYHRLADPVVPEQPRILDVPEELEAFPCAPLLDGLHLPSHAPAAAPADHVELPFAPVSVSQRVLAGVVDCAAVSAAAAVFGGVGYKMLPRMALTKPIILIAAATPIVFWAIYQYLLTMYGGATIGMRMLHLRFSTFKGGPPNWRYRRSRVFGLYFSAASLAMGLLWALVDVDTLCWHDRISRTYLTRQD